MLKCMKRGCDKKFSHGKYFLWKDKMTKINVCIGCYEKRQRWLASRGLPIENEEKAKSCLVYNYDNPFCSCEMCAR